MNICEARETQRRLFASEQMLPEICLCLRMSVNGAADPWPDAYLREVVEMIKTRLQLWRDPTDEMDFHVKGMMSLAVIDGETELARRSREGEVFSS